MQLQPVLCRDLLTIQKGKSQVWKGFELLWSSLNQVVFTKVNVQLGQPVSSKVGNAPKTLRNKLNVSVLVVIVSKLTYFLFFIFQMVLTDNCLFLNCGIMWVRHLLLLVSSFNIMLSARPTSIHIIT